MLEGVTPTLAYYSGTYTNVAQTTSLTPLSGAPSTVGSTPWSPPSPAASTTSAPPPWWTLHHPEGRLGHAQCGDESLWLGRPDADRHTERFVAADGVTATYSRTAGGTVPGGPAPTSAMLSPAGVLSNYSITYNTAALTITKAPLTVTDNQSKLGAPWP